MQSRSATTNTSDLRQELATLNQTLEANNLALEEAQALTHLGSWQWNVVENDITWSDELFRIYGLEPQEFVIDFEKFVDLIHPKDRERVQAIIGAAYQSGEAFEFEHRVKLPNGKIRILAGKGKSVKDSDGKVLRMVGTSQDVTERKQADQALHLSDERFKAVTAATNDVVYDFDIATDSMWFNESLYEQYGYPRKAKNMRHSWWMQQIHPSHRGLIEQAVSELLTSSVTTWQAEYRVKKHDGKYIDVRDRAYVIRDHKNRPLRMIGSVLDITTQKELERAKDEFISLASHQLRTPATAVKQYLGMLQAGYAGEVPEKLEPFINTAYSANERQLTIINDLLKTAQLESGQYVLVKDEYDLEQLLQEVVEAYKPVIAMRHQVISVVIEAPGIIKADIPELKVALSNLLENASKYSPEGSNITLRGTVKPKVVTITVEDEGVGIDNDNLTKIFDKFTRLDNELSDTVNGSGLGLYFVNKIVTLHEGTIHVRSKAHKGSAFTITLPR